ncbi:hypothetical protein LWI29_024571 [Acer saccharum]|uniref:Uncharacterized protein n=1 Tax=Acer saccharum TaxID=4024 RepID=A0AA39W8R4_ACESA|nr:hypothetical protein LWI29_024571 [Acer saccharum]
MDVEDFLIKIATAIYEIYEMLAHNSQQRNANSVRGGKFVVNANTETAIEIYRMNKKMQSLTTYIESMGFPKASVKMLGRQKESCSEPPNDSGGFNDINEEQEHEEVGVGTETAIEVSKLAKQMQSMQATMLSMQSFMTNQGSASHIQERDGSGDMSFNGEGCVGFQEEVQAMGYQQRDRGGVFSQTYNPKWRQHPNLSYSKNNALNSDMLSQEVNQGFNNNQGFNSRGFYQGQGSGSGQANQWNRSLSTTCNTAAASEQGLGRKGFVMSAFQLLLIQQRADQEQFSDKSNSPAHETKCRATKLYTKVSSAKQ